MRAKQIGSDGEQLYALLLDRGEEVVAAVTEFARAHKITAARFSGVGAFAGVTLGYFRADEGRAHAIAVNEPVEVVTLVGEVALDEDQPRVHAHVVVALGDGSARGGRLLAARAHPTLELIFRPSPRHLQRHYDRATGLALLDPDA